MLRISLTHLASWVVAALCLLTWSTTVQAQAGGPLQGEVIKISQATGGDKILKGHLDAVLKETGHAKKLVTAAVKMAKDKDPNLSYNGALILGAAAAKLEDYAACEALYRVCMTKAAKVYSSNKVRQSYFGLIDILNQGKKYPESIRICRELLELKTGDDMAREYRFPVEDRFGNYGFKQDPDFDLARPLKSEVHELMIKALAKDGKIDKALEMADNLVKANDHWEQRQLRGWVLRETGRYAEAAKVYEDVLERIAKDKDLTQKGKDVYTDHFSYLLSGIYVEAKQIDKAADHLKGLIDRNPDDPAYYNDLGYIWADNDMHLKDAEEMIRKALDLDREQRKKEPGFNAAKDQDRGSYLDSLGWALFKQKKYDEAKKYLLEALKDDKAQHLEIFDHLGDTYMALGQREAALDAWRRGLAVVGEDRRDQERKAEVEKKIQKHKK